mmetsp:Transcript_20681/g.35650  ORF Transcript_20681/g.35650 Transcript_20681/m.35650 type:complete len:80 (+) Transcript_20681:70-309(+)
MESADLARWLFMVMAAPVGVDKVGGTEALPSAAAVGVVAVLDAIGSHSYKLLTNTIALLCLGNKVGVNRLILKRIWDWH